MRIVAIGSAVLLSFFALLGCRDETTSVGPSGGGHSSGGTGGGGDGGTGAGANGGTGGSGGTIDPGPDAVIVSLGDPDKILLQGWLITPNESYAGEVLIEGALITCVAPSCSGEPGAASASVVDTRGIIMPGMIDTHNHIQFNIFDEDDWSPDQLYENHNQWPNEPRYSAMIDAKQYLNGESGSPVNINCEMNKYGELKALVAGTTSVTGAANPANKVCYRTVARTIDQSANGLCGTNPPQSCPDNVQVNTLFPSTASADAVCANFADGDTNAYLIHVGEGVDFNALDELEDLRTVTTVDGCLHDPRTTVVHGTAFGEPEFDTMASNGMSLSWSPRSNVFLYGGGTDMTKTTDIPLALSKGLLVGLSPDWSLGGGQNLLEELRFADLVDANQWGDALTPQMLTEMVTRNAAEILSLGDQIGSLTVGLRADITVFGGDPAVPYTSLLAATQDRIRLVIIDGVPLYGDDQLLPLAPSSPGCEGIDICGRAKFLCVAIDGGDGSNKWGQTYAEILSTISQELEAYDALNLTAWDFAPISPLVRCQ